MLTAGTIAQVIAPPYGAQVSTIVGLVSTNRAVKSMRTDGQPWIGVTLIPPRLRLAALSWSTKADRRCWAVA